VCLQSEVHTEEGRRPTSVVADRWTRVRMRAAASSGGMPGAVAALTLPIPTGGSAGRA
jgi:hypothetical protein